jgi:hypothetical protein
MFEFEQLPEEAPTMEDSNSTAPKRIASPGQLSQTGGSDQTRRPVSSFVVSSLEQRRVRSEYRVGSFLVPGTLDIMSVPIPMRRSSGSQHSSPVGSPADSSFPEGFAIPQRQRIHVRLIVKTNFVPDANFLPVTMVKMCEN